MDREKITRALDAELLAFEKSYLEFKGSDGDIRVGEVAHCHLIVEHYLTELLVAAGDPHARTRMEYSQKVQRAMFPGCMLLDMRTALDAFGQIRNGFCHNLSYAPNDAVLSKIREWLQRIASEVTMEHGPGVARPVPQGMEVIEEFTQAASAQFTAVAALYRQKLLEKPPVTSFKEPPRPRWLKKKKR